jgi:hypothetical protein
MCHHHFIQSGVRDMADEDTEKAVGFGLNHYYGSRFHLWANDNVMRFIIGDSVSGLDKDVEYKLAFVLTRPDAEAFLKVAQELLDETNPAKKQNGPE